MSVREPLQYHTIPYRTIPTTPASTYLSGAERLGSCEDFNHHERIIAEKKRGIHTESAMDGMGKLVEQPRLSRLCGGNRGVVVVEEEERDGEDQRRLAETRAPR